MAMFSRRSVLGLLVCVPLLLLGFSLTHAQSSWRSALYPDNWQPGQKDGQGRFLHDFSYAGYHYGEDPIPTNPSGNTYNVTQAPYNADDTGAVDATAAIQQAINDAGNAGGGVVYLPSGTYKVTLVAGKRFALHLNQSNVVLRGDGPSTRIFNDNKVIRQQEIILVSPDENLASWADDGVNPSSVRPLTSDVFDPATDIPVSDASGYSVGDWIVLRADATAAFSQEHNMGDKWYPEKHKGTMFYRQITAISGNVITINVPTRYFLKTRDNARIYKVNPHLSEVGIEDLAIGGRQNTTGGYGHEDYRTEGKGAYEVHGSHAIRLNHTLHSWVRGVETYRPSANSSNVHLNSNMLLLDQSAFVTVADTHFARPLYEGGGGNGYMYTLRSNESLIRDSIGEHSRHNFDFKSMWSSGNVILNSTGKDGSLKSDFHMHLSPSNLFDNFTLDNESLEARYRDSGTNKDHGQTTTQSVFWNTNSINSGNSLTSGQWGWGYVIGTRGSSISVNTPTNFGTSPQDFTEGIGNGDALVPQSLYLDQLSRRLGTAPPTPTPPAPTPTPGSGDGNRLDVIGTTASTFQVPNTPSNTLDGDLITRWSAQGSGQWIQYDLGTPQALVQLRVAWFKGNERSSQFDVQLSDNGASWTTLLNNVNSSGATLNLEPYDLPSATARYLRLVGRGNSSNDWNSITEVEIYGAGAGSTLLNEQFNSTATGSVPAGWVADAGGGTVAVVDVPSASDKSLQLDDTSGSVNTFARADFAAQSGPITAEFRVMFAVNKPYYLELWGDGTEAVRVKAQNGKLEYSSGSNYVTLQSYSTNTWYAIRIVADPATDKADVSIDGTPRISGANFRNATGSLDGFRVATQSNDTGTMFVDAVVVQAGGAASASLVEESGEGGQQMSRSLYLPVVTR